jgi:hypothetical protein
MNIFKREDKTPRSAFREQRNGVKIYYVEVWASYESGSMWSQESKVTTDLEEAKKLLQEIRDKEIVACGVLTTNK